MPMAIDILDMLFASITYPLICKKIFEIDHEILEFEKIFEIDREF
jgi:hypothetical protein